MSIVSIINTNFDTTKKQNIPGAYKTPPLIFKSFMGIDHLQLSPELIAALYPETLVAGTMGSTVKKAVKTSPPALLPAYHFLGKNLRSVCFLVNYPDHPFLPDDKLVFITKMLTACKYNLEDISLINISKQQVEIAELRIQLNPQIIFLWGVLPSQIGIAQKGYPDLTVSAFDNISLLPVQHADLISGDSTEGLEMKKILWSALKKLFKL
jgi:hypothetical protein